jgi:hypothetical protein
VGVMSRVANDQRIACFLVATLRGGTPTNQEPQKC